MPDDRWYPAIIVAGLLAAIFYVLHATLPQPLPPRSPRAPTQEQQSPAEKQQRSGGKIALPVEIIPGPEHAADAAEQKKQADENAATEKDLADATWKLAYFTLALAAFAGVQMGLFVWQLLLINASLQDTKIAALAARDSADAAKQSFIADNRAWLRINVTIGSDGANINENGARVAICYRIENIGNAPAINITPHAWLVAYKGGYSTLADLMSENGDIPIQVQRRKCNELRSKPLGIIGFSLFPNEFWPDVEGISEAQNKIRLDKIDMQRVLRESGEPGFGIFIVGCVDYTFSADSSNHHQTWFSYSLAKGTDKTKIIKTDDFVIITPSFFQVDDGNISRDNLALISDPFGMGRHTD